MRNFFQKIGKLLEVLPKIIIARRLITGLRSEFSPLAAVEFLDKAEEIFNDVEEIVK